MTDICYVCEKPLTGDSVRWEYPNAGDATRWEYPDDGHAVLLCLACDRQQRRLMNSMRAEEEVARTSGVNEAGSPGHDVRSEPR